MKKPWIRIEPITVETMTEFVAQHHYSAVMPRITKACFGGFRGNNLVAAVSYGWGSRPRHTIKRIFPSLDTTDYLEIGKMCLRDDEPKNSESKFLASTNRLVYQKFQNLKLIFTWADGLWGKPGYVYQASSFLYGGFIWTDVYVTESGKKLHPLQLQAERRRRGMDTVMRTQRPTAEEMVEMGWKHYWGKQFRYTYFLCDYVLPPHRRKRERLAGTLPSDKLIAQSPFAWGTAYPKHVDLEWKQSIGGAKVPCEQPRFNLV